MAENTKTSRALLTIALKTYRTEILGELTGSKRYIGAMIANALDIAGRSLAASAPETHLTELLGKAELDHDALAAAIRNGQISEQSHPGLHDALSGFVRAKLEISNPRFLQQRDS